MLLTSEGRSDIDYMMAMGANEILWAERYAKPHMNYCRSVDTPELPEEYISLLKRYLVLVPHLASTVPKELHSKTLCHRDLHLDNIFVDPDTKDITNIIDWQSTAVSEIFFQHKVPLMLPLPNSDNAEEASPDMSKLGNCSGHGVDVFTHYQKLTQTKNPLRWAAINLLHGSTLTKPTSLVSGAWGRNDMFSFRHALIAIAAYWKDIAPNPTSCPITFTKEELERHNEEMELLEDLSTVLHLLQDQNLISVGGRVLRENYDQAQAVNKHVKEMLLDLAENEQEKSMYDRIGPY